MLATCKQLRLSLFLRPAEHQLHAFTCKLVVGPCWWLYTPVTRSVMVLWTSTIKHHLLVISTTMVRHHAVLGQPGVLCCAYLSPLSTPTCCRSAPLPCCTTWASAVLLAHGCMCMRMCMMPLRRSISKPARPGELASAGLQHLACLLEALLQCWVLPPAATCTDRVCSAAILVDPHLIHCLLR